MCCCVLVFSGLSCLSWNKEKKKTIGENPTTSMRRNRAPRFLAHIIAETNTQLSQELTPPKHIPRSLVSQRPPHFPCRTTPHRHRLPTYLFPSSCREQGKWPWDLRWIAQGRDAHTSSNLSARSLFRTKGGSLWSVCRSLPPPRRRRNEDIGESGKKSLFPPPL